MRYIPVKNNKNLLRDSKTNCIINVDSSEHQRYLKMKQQKQHEEQRIQNLEENFDRIKGDIEEIKFLLRGLINES